MIRKVALRFIAHLRVAALWTLILLLFSLLYLGPIFFARAWYSDENALLPGGATSLSTDPKHITVYGMYEQEREKSLAHNVERDAQQSTIRLNKRNHVNAKSHASVPHQGSCQLHEQLLDAPVESFTSYEKDSKFNFADRLDLYSAAVLQFSAICSNCEYENIHSDHGIESLRLVIFTLRATRLNSNEIILIHLFHDTASSLLPSVIRFMDVCATAGWLSRDLVIALTAPSLGSGFSLKEHLARQGLYTFCMISLDRNQVQDSSQPQIQFRGFSTQVPNLDFVNLAVKMGDISRLLPLLHRDELFAPDFSSLMYYWMFLISTLKKLPDREHLRAEFIAQDVPSVSLIMPSYRCSRNISRIEGVDSNTTEDAKLTLWLEHFVHSISNLEERLHHSTNLWFPISAKYFLPGSIVLISIYGAFAVMILCISNTRGLRLNWLALPLLCFSIHINDGLRFDFLFGYFSIGIMIWSTNILLSSYIVNSSHVLSLRSPTHYVYAITVTEMLIVNPVASFVWASLIALVYVFVGSNTKKS